MGVEARAVVGGDGVGGLERVLRGGVSKEGGVRGYVVPGVVFVDVVCGVEVTGTEFEGVGTFEVGEGVVGAVGGWVFWFWFWFWFLMR